LTIAVPILLGILFQMRRRLADSGSANRQFAGCKGSGEFDMAAVIHAWGED
jgi:hypothetical protein